MKLDQRLLTGLLLGAVIGLHYHTALVSFMPVLMIAALILLLKLVHH